MKDIAQLGEDAVDIVHVQCAEMRRAKADGFGAQYLGDRSVGRGDLIAPARSVQTVEKLAAEPFLAGVVVIRMVEVGMGFGVVDDLVPGFYQEPVLLRKGPDPAPDQREAGSAVVFGQ